MKYYLHRPTGQIHRQAQQPFFNRQTAGNDLPIVQTKLSVSSPTDEHEKEADKTADKVMRMPEGTASPMPISTVQRKCDHCEEEDKKTQRKETPTATNSSFVAPPSVSKAINRSGQPLESKAQSFMESRFSRQFGHVQVHTDSESAQSARDIQARAYTSGNHIVFADGQYQPHTEGGRHLLAHELTHVLQQKKASIQRKVEMRDVGKGEQSGFARLPELIAKLNAVSTGLIYEMDGSNLNFKLKAGGTLSSFDTQMKNFIEAGKVIPLRLTNRHGLIGDRAAGFHDRIFVDGWESGYVDIDDLLASSNLGLQLTLVHFIAERNATGNYASRIGSPNLKTDDGSGNITPEFAKAHNKGLDAELEVLRSFFDDPSINVVSKANRVYKNSRKDVFRTKDKANSGGLIGTDAISVEITTHDKKKLNEQEYIDLIKAEKAKQDLIDKVNNNAIEHHEGKGGVPPK